MSSVIILLAATGCDQKSGNAFTKGRTQGDGSFGPFDQEMGFDVQREPVLIEHKSPLNGISSIDSSNGYIRGENGKPVSIKPVSQNPYAN